MTDRSTGRVCNVPGGEEQPRGAPESPAPPHLPHSEEGESQHSSSHPSPHPDPHKLELQQGDLRDRFGEARGSPPAPGNLTGQATSDQRHHHSDPIPSQQPQHLPETQPSSSEAPHSAPADPPTFSPSTTATRTPVQAPAATTAISAASSTSSTGGTPTPRVADRDHIRTLASGEPSPVSSGLATPTTTDQPHRRHLRSLRPLVRAIMAFEKGRKFSTGTSVHRKRQMSTLVEKEGHFGPALTVCLVVFVLSH